MSQLASFSSVEQLVNTNSKLDALLTQSELSQARLHYRAHCDLIGRQHFWQVGSVEITSCGVTAILASGQTLSLGSGVVIS